MDLVEWFYRYLAEGGMLTDAGWENYRRHCLANEILRNRDPYKKIPQKLMGREPWLDLVAQFCQRD